MIDFKAPTQRYFPARVHWDGASPVRSASSVPCRITQCSVSPAMAAFITTSPNLRPPGATISTSSCWNNNSGLNQEITLNKINYGGKPRGNWTDLWTFTDNNFAKIAEAFGCVGIRVEKPGEIRGALDHAFGLNKPVVIDVVTDVNVLAKRVPH